MRENSELTGGLRGNKQKQGANLVRRLSIAMAPISEPITEPALGLDVLARRELWRVTSALKGKITIIPITHYMEKAKELSDRKA